MRLPMYPKDSVYRVFCDKPRYTRGIPRPTAFQTRVISLIYHGFILKPSGKLERTLVQRIRSDFLSISDLYQFGPEWLGPEKSWTRNLGPGRIGKESLRSDQGQMGQTFRTKKRKLRLIPDLALVRQAVRGSLR